MDVPVLIDPKDVPVGATKEGAKNDHRHPQRDEPDQEGDHREGPLAKDVVSVSDLVEIDVGNGHQAAQDHRGENHTGQPRIVVHQHFLQPQEIPRGLGRVGCLGTGGGFFQRGLQHNAPDDQQRGDRDHADQLAVNQVRPNKHLLVLVVLQHRHGSFAVPIGQSPVVLDGAGEVQPGEPTDQVQQRHDRDVVRFSDNLSEIVVGHRERHEQDGGIEHHPANRWLDQELAKPQHSDRADDREDEVSDRVGHNRVDGRLEDASRFQCQRELVDIVLAALAQMHEPQDQQDRGVQRPEGGNGQLNFHPRQFDVPAFLVDPDCPPQVHHAQHQVQPAQSLQHGRGQVGMRIDERVNVHGGCFGWCCLRVAG